MTKKVYPITRYTLFPLIRFFIKKTLGLENLPKKGPYLIACKHMGPLDGVFIGAVIVPYINQKLYYFTNVAQWGWVWEKLVAERWAGSIPYYRDNPGASLEIANELIRQGKVIGIFPEGIIQDYGQRGRAKTGAARLAIWHHIPIVPVGLVHDISVRTDLPRMFRKRQVLKNILLNPHSLEIHIGQPFEISQYYGRDMTHEMLIEATNAIMMNIEKLTKINVIS
ncbi:MAG: lysophospholipid acyltransferase family protein [Patescibacteria group bacterium]